MAEPIIDLTGSREVARSAPAKSSGLGDFEIRAIAQAMAMYCRETFGPELMEKHVEPLLKARTRRLEERIRELEQRPLLEDAGIWNRSTEYHPGQCVTFDGSYWVCKTMHRHGKPGETDCWRLLVRRGRDGRDSGR